MAMRNCETVRAYTLGALLALLGGLSGCVNDSESISSQAPRSGVYASQTSAAARIAQRGDENRITGPGRGDSMQPLFGPNDYLVIDPIAYEDLQPDMIVAYKDLGGRRVVHRLVEREGDYWTVAGINNPLPDADYVTPDNLIGVVYGVFHGN